MNKKEDYNNDDMCTECQDKMDEASNYCYKQKGRKCYLDDQAEGADTSFFPDLDYLLND